jgi:hypothetical protein
MLAQYTLEELYYEYREHIEREKAAKEKIEQEADNIDKAKEDAALAWAEAEEKREAEIAAKSQSAQWQPNEQDKAWMEEQLRQAKEVYGDDFGEDISEDFEDG